MADAIKYFSGDTIRIQVTFRDWTPEGSTTPGALIDPDTVTVTVYDEDQNVIQTGSPVRSSLGVYFYNWITPNEAGKYFVEFRGVLNGEPLIIREDYYTKFKV